jgi:hypothetical protein
MADVQNYYIVAEEIVHNSLRIVGFYDSKDKRYTLSIGGQCIRLDADSALNVGQLINSMIYKVKQKEEGDA